MSNFPFYLRFRDFAPFIALFGVFVVMSVILYSQGRLWIAQSGHIYLWVSDVWSSDNSQHLSDPYSFSHIQHGVLFFGLFWLFRNYIGSNWRLVFAIALEAAWELFENSAFVINRYRESTAALGYNGDTILNSIGDLLSCFLGYIIAFKLKLYKSIAFFLAVEIIMIIAIRDSLLLNIIMLIHPIQAIKDWQMQG